MKRIIIYSAWFVFLVSCSHNTDKKAKLEKLKMQLEQLNTQIAQLEAEINPSDTVAKKGVAVNVTPAVESVFNHFIQVQGTVDGDQNIAVSPQIAGIVTSVNVKEGDHVKKGQVLAELDAQVIRQSLEEVNTQLALANNIFEKQSALWEKKIGSEVQYLEAKTSKESLEKRVKTIEEQLNQAKILSPIDGTIESMPLRVGQMASPGLPASTIRVINMSVAKITAEVSEAYATRIRNGNDVIVSFPDQGKEIGSRLSFTSRFIDPTNRTFKVECKVSSKDIELRANMMAYIKIKDYTNAEAFCLPANYIQSHQGDKFIYIARMNGGEWVAERRNVKTGMDYNGTTEILEGITAGEKIITSGFQNLNPGEKVVF
ncbi:MAG: efflux RND transporter periplasmic adaptor subunit [Mangrovibacterium sp.]